MLPCCICGTSSDCTVERWRYKFHIMYIPTRTVEERLLFTWQDCGHSTAFLKEKMETEYIRFMDGNDIFSVPNCQDRPWPVTWKSLLLISPLILGVGALVVFFLLTILALIILSIAGALGLL
jgi:hypothetical protein